GIEPVDQVQQFGLAGARRKIVVERTDADLLGRATLVAHVGLRGRIPADQHHRQSRARQVGGDACIDAQAQFVEQGIGDALAVEDACGHAVVEAVNGNAYCLTSPPHAAKERPWTLPPTTPSTSRRPSSVGCANTCCCNGPTYRTST